MSVAWNPNSLHHVVAVAVGDTVSVLNMETSSGHASELTSNLLSKNKEIENEEDEEKKKSDKSEATWTQQSKDRLDVVLTSTVRQVVWHSRGNYFATVCPSSSSPSKRVAVRIVFVFFTENTLIIFSNTGTHSLQTSNTTSISTCQGDGTMCCFSSKQAHILSCDQEECSSVSSSTSTDDHKVDMCRKTHLQSGCPFKW